METLTTSFSKISGTNPLIKPYNLFDPIMVLIFGKSMGTIRQLLMVKKMIIIKRHGSEILLLGYERLRPQEAASHDFT